MKPSHYTSEALFKKDIELIHHRLWLFAGFKFSLARPNDFFTRDLAGVPVIVQNVAGEISAFVNSCAHRSAKLSTDDFGKKPLRCPYHGWEYGKNGRVSKIPAEHDCYKFSPELRESLGLKPIALTIVGELIFLNFSSSPLPIEEQFNSELLKGLHDLSLHLDREFIFSKKLGRYNWKLAIENLNDDLHQRFVHSKYFSPNETPVPVSDHDDSILVELPQLSYFEKTPANIEQRRLPYFDQVHRFGNFQGFYNWLLYPNLHITSFNGGYAFVIEQYNPVGVQETELVQFVLSAKKIRPYPESSAVLWNALKGTRNILDEDQKILEQTQAGINDFSPPPSLGIFEAKNKRMGSWYLKQLGGNE